jgi:hypothetical protein
MDTCRSLCIGQNIYGRIIIILLYVDVMLIVRSLKVELFKSFDMEDLESTCDKF